MSDQSNTNRVTELERRLRGLIEECRVHREVTQVLRRELIKTQEKVRLLEAALLISPRGLKRPAD